MTLTNIGHTITRGSAIAAFAFGVAGPAHAGYYTDFTAPLNAIYSQATFGLTPVSIRFDSVLTINSNTLNTIDSALEFDTLAAMGVASPTVSAFFVDTLGFCGVVLAGIDGCGSTPGHTLIVASTVDSFVFGHELGHNFGLSHDETPGNLMRAQSEATDLSLLPYQVQTILNAAIVQTDALGNKFIEIQPYVVVSSVPEPSTYAMMAFGVAGLAFLRKRKAA